MSLEEYSERLFQQATGIMGWLPDDVMYMDVTDIEAACSGRWEMVNKILSAVFGEPEGTKELAASGNSFAAMARMNGIEVRNV